MLTQGTDKTNKTTVAGLVSADDASTMASKEAAMMGATMPPWAFQENRQAPSRGGHAGWMKLRSRGRTLRQSLTVQALTADSASTQNSETGAVSASQTSSFKLADPVKIQMGT
eukprot:CAMPEP_0206600856 /NCGR_PEP_ID=MMETSP0325_2-20121206/46135_1 /ASSEMBLY_ACC=CAM_ASM_000347 /TAXON_ID=2866 /ORGANISM="Crypthecodinium cohnii, Strain Seligo" /LENGTH=112 /DNA_ID=CAMNT_0054112421 /DNA_START=486 /DNA_END=826 /DNA_ORIENTATION=+